MIKKRVRIVTPEYVSELISERTGVPSGTVSESEKDTLLNLENFLARRVVGQSLAIKAISTAMRRSRSGVSNPKRPIGSFLFLGPTGVGKTETSKALAEAVFETEASLMRLDMSEFNSVDALNRLIGTVNGDTGILTSMLREKQYGVLLLDEFEKTDVRVLDLFLQILDEGVFSDAMGKKVNARNIIFIATSNAGSDLIWKTMKEGKDLKNERENIIHAIIDRGIFRPELLNRFDGAILFNALGEHDLYLIAELMLKKLKKRIAEQHIELVVTKELIEELAKNGSNPEFGARPLNRYIQDTIEPYVANMILLGQAKPGDKVTITKEVLDRMGK